MKDGPSHTLLPVTDGLGTEQPRCPQHLTTWCLTRWTLCTKPPDTGQRISFDLINCIRIVFSLLPHWPQRLRELPLPRGMPVFPIWKDRSSFPTAHLPGCTRLAKSEQDLIYKNLMGCGMRGRQKWKNSQRSSLNR